MKREKEIMNNEQEISNVRKCCCICGCEKKFAPYISGMILKRAVMDICPDCYEKRKHKEKSVDQK